MAGTTYDPTAPVRYTVTPRVFSEVNLRTRPRAVCTIGLDGSRDPSAALRIHADATGMVRLNVRPSGESEELLKLSIECELDGKVTHYPLDLRASFEPTRELPAPPAYESEVTAEGRHRPALTAREMIDLPGDVLLERGYPLRPDRHEAPLAYRTWCQMAAAPMTIVPAHLTPRPDIQPGKGAPTEAAVGTSNIWSGFVGTRDNSKAKLTWPGKSGSGATADPFDWVSGRWTVPYVSGEYDRPSYSTLWVGLDGYGTTDLVQAGTESDGIKRRIGPMSYTITSSYAWTEFLPQQALMQVLGLPVTPGDEMVVVVWMGDQGSATPNPTGGFGAFSLTNMTRRVSTAPIYTPIGSTNVSGTEAVWVMERPTVSAPASGIFAPSGYIPDLANYGSAVLSDAYAHRAGIGYLRYLDVPTVQVSMVDSRSTDVLSTVTALDSTSMRFDWKAFN